jgi:hypothetical protein
MKLKPFERAAFEVEASVDKYLADYGRRPEFYRETFHVEDASQVAFMVRRSLNVEAYLNDLYQVSVYRDEAAADWPAMIHLSIRRRDREPIHDWRVLQEIKNAIVGPEHEGVELYPAESRLVDTANQYHLFVIADSGIRFPFGFPARSVTEDESLGSRQRPFDRTPPGVGQAEDGIHKQEAQ